MNLTRRIPYLKQSDSDGASRHSALQGFPTAFENDLSPFQYLSRPPGASRG